MSNETDRIVKQTVLRAPRARVWQAISQSREFGAWFGAALDGPFAAGARVTGRIVPTQVDPEVAAQQKPYEGMRMDLFVERIEPERVLSFRWHPTAPEPGDDVATAPTTLVTFELEEVPEGTRLTITESGFDRIPLARRALAFKSNEGGWTAQLELIRKYVTRGT